VAFAIGLPATLRCKRRLSPQRGSEQQRIDDPQRAVYSQRTGSVDHPMLRRVALSAWR